MNCEGKPAVQTAELGPYKARSFASGDYGIAGPGLAEYYMPRWEQAKDLAMLLNLAYAFGLEDGRSAKREGEANHA